MEECHQACTLVQYRCTYEQSRKKNLQSGLNALMRNKIRTLIRIYCPVKCSEIAQPRGCFKYHREIKIIKSQEPLRVIVKMCPHFARVQ